MFYIFYIVNLYFSFLILQYFFLCLTMFIVTFMHQNIKANSMYVKTYLARYLILIRSRVSDHSSVLVSTLPGEKHLAV